MESIQINFIVDAARNCPVYKAGMHFSLQDNFLKVPDCHEICLVLARKMTEILMNLMASVSNNNTFDAANLYTCGGCSGLIKFSKCLSDKQKIVDLNLLLSQKNDLLQLLATCDPLKEIEPSNLVELIVHAEQHRLAPNTILVKKGTIPKFVFLVLSGTATVIEQGTRIAEITAGQLFGEMSLFCNQPASATVVAKTNLDILIIPTSDFKNFMRTHESVQDYLVRQLVKRLEESNMNRVRDNSSCMRGRLSDIGPAELLQTFNMHQLTGTLNLQLKNFPAKIAFKDGAIVSAQFRDLSDKEALYAVFKQKEGTFLFSTDLLPEDQEAEELGDFMMLIMEGCKQADEMISNIHGECN